MRLDLWGGSSANWLSQLGSTTGNSAATSNSNIKASKAASKSVPSPSTAMMQQKKHAEALEPNVKATGAQAGSKWHSPVGESTHRSPSGRTQKIVQNAKKERPILAHLCQNQNGPVGPCDWQRLTLQICECDACKYHDCGMEAQLTL